MEDRYSLGYTYLTIYFANKRSLFLPEQMLEPGGMTLEVVTFQEIRQAIQNHAFRSNMDTTYTNKRTVSAEIIV